MAEEPGAHERSRRSRSHSGRQDHLAAIVADGLSVDVVVLRADRLPACLTDDRGRVGARLVLGATLLDPVELQLVAPGRGVTG